MTNLEFHKSEFNSDLMMCQVAYICKHGKPCSNFFCRSCEFLESTSDCVKAMVEPCKEKIKLKQWEYDLIRTNDMSHGRTFDSFNTYRSMKSCGHFAGIKNISMTLEEILENCEVIK